MKQPPTVDISHFEEHLANYLLCPLGPDAVTVDIELRPEVVERVQALVARRGITTDAFFNAIANCILDFKQFEQHEHVKFGYARVSTPSQHLDRQLTAMTAFGCDEIIAEKRSAKDIAQRPALQALLAQLRKGDILVVAEWDRATRSFLDGIAIMQHVLRTGATLRVLDINLDLADPIQQALVGVLSAIAQKERERNLSRAQDGRVEAKRRGVRMGRRPALSPAQMTEMLERHRSGETPARLAVSYGVSKSTITRVIARVGDDLV